MRARAPGSGANLGPGFDAVAIALQSYIEVEVSEAPSFVLEAHGAGADIPADRSHLAARVVTEVLGHDRVRITVESGIPVARGLGSSAALALAAAAAAGAEDPLRIAVAVDGHAENAAASFLGGLVVATIVNGRPVARRVALDPTLRFVAVMPERPLETSLARSVLPAVVDRADAVQNIGRFGLLLAGLADAASLVPQACDDLLHEPYRASLFPEAQRLIEALKAGGAVTACWSGAGPSLLGICVGDEAAEAAGNSARAAMDELGVPGEVSPVLVDVEGLVVSP